jgi:hypothetical protein
MRVPSGAVRHPGRVISSRKSVRGSGKGGGMKKSKPAWLLILLLAWLPEAGLAQADPPRRGSFFGGIGILRHTDFFIFTKWGDSKMDRSASSPHPFVGYIRNFPSDGLGLSVTVGGSWFELPDFGIELFPDAPVEMRQIVDYFSVKMALVMADFDLVLHVRKRWSFEAGFSFGVQSDSKTRHELDAFTDPFHPRTWRITEKKAFAVGGAVIGLNHELTRRLAVAARGRLIVGRTTASGYVLYVNGVRMGDPYVKTDYMKQVSLGLLYRI